MGDQTALNQQVSIERPSLLQGRVVCWLNHIYTVELHYGNDGMCVVGILHPYFRFYCLNLTAYVRYVFIYKHTGTKSNLHLKNQNQMKKESYLCLPLHAVITKLVVSSIV